MGSGGSKQKQKEAKCKSDEVIVEPVTTKANTISVSKPKEVQEVYSPNKPEKIVQYKVQQPSKGDDENDFFKYSDPNDSSVMGMDGLVKFLADVGIDGEGVDSLYLLYIMETEQLNSIKSSEYANLLKKAKVFTALEAKGYIKAELKKVNESEDHFK